MRPCAVMCWMARRDYFRSAVKMRATPLRLVMTEKGKDATRHSLPFNIQKNLNSPIVLLLSRFCLRTSLLSSHCIAAQPLNNQHEDNQHNTKTKHIHYWNTIVAYKLVVGCGYCYWFEYKCILCFYFRFSFIFHSKIGKMRWNCRVK